MNTKYIDVCIIGSGAGGAMASKILSDRGLTVAIVEQGDIIPPGVSLESINKDWEKAYARDEKGNWGLIGYPWTASAVGGGTIFYGGVSFRYRDIDFNARKYVVPEALDPKWPISYKDLETYYNKVEDLLGVSGDLTQDPYTPNPSRGELYPPHGMSPQGRLIRDSANKLGLHPFPTPLAINNLTSSQFSPCQNLTPCTSYSCPSRAKADSYTRIIQPLLKKENVTLLKNTKALRFLQNNMFSIDELECLDMKTKQTYRIKAKQFVLAGNAIQSAALVLRSNNKWWPNGIGNKYGLVGAGLCFKVSGYISGILPTSQSINEINSNKGGLYSTVSITDYYIDDSCPTGLGGLIYEANPWDKKDRANNKIQLECILADQPMASNRILLSNKKNKFGIPEIIIDYSTHRLDKKRLTYLQSKARELLLSAGVKDIQTIPPDYYLGSAHLHGTCRAGDDEKDSVVDKFGRFHTLDNLTVVDGSYMPFPGGVNPTLTIQANALRIAEGLSL
ncbi:GMC oxidoreductase [Virgibacillus pantothenticus]|uniref:GMC oxidoreductase n=1 Tax=Virgibacillus pantothenticus TaxID=1473 RepID=UPI0009841BD4|nr:GMC family oxidoreductase [Virgibacillus pantothenticus]